MKTVLVNADDAVALLTVVCDAHASTAVDSPPDGVSVRARDYSGPWTRCEWCERGLPLVSPV